MHEVETEFGNRINWPIKNGTKIGYLGQLLDPELANRVEWSIRDFDHSGQLANPALVR